MMNQEGQATVTNPNAATPYLRPVDIASEDLQPVVEWLVSLKSESIYDHVISRLKREYEKECSQDKALKVSLNTFESLSDEAGILSNLLNNVLYLRITLSLCDLFLEKCQSGQSDIPLQHDTNFYKKMRAKVVNRVFEISLIPVMSLFRDYADIAKSITMIDRHLPLYKKLEKRFSELYLTMDDIFETSQALHASLDEEDQSAETLLCLLKIKLEVLILRSATLKKNVKAAQSDIYRLLEEFETVSQQVNEARSCIEALDLKVRIYLEVERNYRKAGVAADQMNFYISQLALDDDCDDAELIWRINHYYLLKLAITQSEITAGLVMDLPAMSHMAVTLYWLKYTIDAADPNVRLQLHVLLESIIAHLITEAEKFHLSNDLGFLRSLRPYLDELGKVVAYYEHALSYLNNVRIFQGKETHAVRLKKLNSNIQNKTMQLLKDEVENRRKKEALKAKIQTYHEKMDQYLAESLAAVKPSRLSKPRFVQPRPGLPKAPMMVDEVATQEPSQPKAISVAEKANAYLYSVFHLEAIANYHLAFPSIDHAEVLFYMGDRCFKLGLFGSALTHYEHSLICLEKASPIYNELLAAIRFSLDDLKEVLAEQIEFGSIYLKDAQNERHHFILSLGVKERLDVIPSVSGLEVLSKEILDECYQRGLAIFKALGKKNRDNQRPVSAKTKKLRNIEERLSIFMGNHDRADELLDSVDEQRAADAAPRVSASAITLFSAAGADIAKVDNQGLGVKPRH